MNVYYNRPSDRVSEGEPNRIARNFRLHPDRIVDLDVLARKWNVTKARAIEHLIEAAHQHLTQRSLFDGVADGEDKPEEHPTPAAFTYPPYEPSPPDVLDGDDEGPTYKTDRASHATPKTRKRTPKKEGKKS